MEQAKRHGDLYPASVSNYFAMVQIAASRNEGSNKTSVLISLKFEISRQRQRSRECMEQAKRAGTNGHDLD